MKDISLRLAAVLVAFGLPGAAQTPKKAPPKPPLATAAPAGAPAKKTANDKATLEAYVRHLFVWDKQIGITIDEAKPAPMAGFVEYTVHATAGPAKQDETFYVSKDGQKILRGTVYDVAQNPFKSDLAKLKTEFQPSMGTAGAPVVLVLFSDFQCPYCKEEAKMLRTNLLSSYPKNVRLYFKDYPLDAIHPWAHTAALGGRCVFQQSGAAFWQFHDWMFEHQGEITAENAKAKMLEWAKTAKDFDVLQFTRCLDTKATEAEIAKSVSEAQDLRVAGTPALFINGRRIPNGLGWNDLRSIIDFEIEYQKTAKNAGEDCGCETKLPGPGLN